MTPHTDMANALLYGTVLALGAVVGTALRGSGRLAALASDLWLVVEAGEPEAERPSLARRAGHFALTLLALSLPERGRR